MEPMSCKSSMANWSDLPQELVVCISREIDSMQDFVIFGAVCKPWSSAGTKENFTPGLRHQVPLLMLPGIKDNSNPIPGQCYNLRKDYTVMVSTDYGGEFTFWRPKDKWNFISSKLDTWDWDSDRRSYDIAYYKGQFHIVDSDGRVLVFDIDDPEDATANKVVVSESPTWSSRYSVNQLYLVESGGALLLVLRLEDTCQNGFRVFEVPLSSGNWLEAEEVKNLGNRALFLLHRGLRLFWL
ncbi:hypothetical protein ACLB2K_048776 [Fragaria x ananassa]